MPNPLIPSQEAREAAAIPRAIEEQACTISKTGSQVLIECATAVEATQLFEWLCGLPDRIQAIRKDEAEQCARVAEALGLDHKFDSPESPLTSHRIAAALRARHDREGKLNADNR